MNVKEHLLTCLAEECAKIADACAKSLLFGLDDRNILDATGPTNRERLIAEINDFAAVIQLLEQQHIIKSDWFSCLEQFRKKEKVKKFMEYAEKVGALKP